MSTRALVIGAAWVLCVGSVFGVLSQRSRLTILREQHRQLAPAPENQNTISERTRPASGVPEFPEADSRELIRLRAEVTRLTARKGELAGVIESSEQLRAQLNSGQTNLTGIQVPPGYIRKSEAQFVGYSTPESTVQSFLWALQRRDITNVLHALVESQAQGITSRFEAEGGPEPFFKSMDPMPGLAIQNRKEFSDGSVDLQVVVGPGLPPQTLHLSLINGEWKMERW